MEIDIDVEVFLKHLRIFCCTPCFSDETVDVCPQHGAGVIDHKKRVPLKFFKFTLPNDSSLSTFEALIVPIGKKFMNKLRIIFMLIWFNRGIFFNDSFQTMKKSWKSLLVPVITPSIFFSRKFGEKTKSRNDRNLGPQNKPSFRVDSNWNAQRFELGVFGCDQVIELKVIN